MPNLDVEMARPLAEELVANGIELLLNSAVTAVEKSPSGAFRVVLDGGRPCRRRPLRLLRGRQAELRAGQAAGLSLGFRDGIVVDETMRTDDPDVFAVGDAVQVRDLALDQPAMIPLAGPANRQGRVAADNVFGVKSVYKGSQGTSVIKVFGMTAASTGANEARLKQAGRDFIKVYLHPFNHAGYYPGGEQMVVKALFEKSSGKLLGAQIVAAPASTSA
jgi:NADPH-dependent 2,4-dienoyl-CoA reductase/sulfur reductase-like enzyme